MFTDKIKNILKEKKLNSIDFIFESRLDKSNKSFYYNKKTKKYEEIGYKGKMSEEIKNGLH